MPKPYLALLGPFQLRTDTASRTRTLSRKTQALLGYLAASAAAHPRSLLAEWFCADADDPSAALRWHLSRIRAGVGTDALLADNATVALNAAALDTDYHVFTSMLQADPTTLTTPVLQNAVALYRGELLRDLYLGDAPEFELWLLGERERLRTLYERGVTELLERAIAAHDFENALARAKQILESNPLLEYAHARLIWLYAQTGQRAAAQRQYDYCRELLRRELAVEPSPEVQQLMTDLAAQTISPLQAPARRTLISHAPRIGFVGRDAELAALGRAWHAADTRVLFIIGAAGSGKSSLVHEFSTQVQATFLYGKCAESAQHLPYRPWLQILETRLPYIEPRALETLPVYWRTALARLIPGLATQDNAARLDARVADELILQRAIAEFLWRVPRVQPQLFCLDDMQWADQPSLALFHALVRDLTHSEHAPALLVGTIRAEELNDNPALLALLDDYADAPRLNLDGLSEAAVMELVGELWQTLPQRAQADTATRLARATGGNPLFLIELVRELANGAGLPAALPVPASTRQLIARRLRRFPDSSRQVLEALSVASAPLAVHEIQNASARTEDETVNALDLGLSGGLLHADVETIPARYFFAHDLLREAVVAQQSDARRRQLHRRLAKQFAQQAQHLPRGERETWAARIQHHAQQGQAFELVWEWAPPAAARAERVGAYADALAALEQAERAYENLSPDAKRETDIALAELLLDKINVLQQLGRWQETTVDLERVAPLLGNAHAVLLHANFALRRAVTCFALAQYDAAAQFAETAYNAFLEHDAPAYAAEALSLAGRVHMTIAENPTARALLERALALWRQTDDLRALGRCLTHLALCQVELGQLDSARAYLTEALALADQRADMPARASAAYILAHTWNMYGHRALTKQWAETASALFQNIGSDAYAARAEMYLAVVAFADGEQVNGLAITDRILATAQATGDVWLEGWGLFLKGSFALLRGEIEAAGQCLHNAHRLRRESGESQNQVTDLTWLGLAELAQKHSARALEYTAAAVTQLDALRQRVYVWETPRVLLVHAQALDANGHAEAARAFLARAQTELDDFAARIADPALREIYFASPLAAALLRARQTGNMPPLY